GLQTIRLPGGRILDPYVDDPFVVLVEERRRIERDPTLTDTERARRAAFYKGLVNSLAYGLPGRLDTTKQPTARPVTIYSHGKPATRPENPLERPGRYCFPPIAAVVPAVARLQLALVESLLADAEF